MSASDAGNSNGGELYVCHSSSSPEAPKEMALPSGDLSLLLLPQVVQALLALRGRKIGMFWSAPHNEELSHLHPM